jgi:hypothetical protein
VGYIAERSRILDEHCHAIGRDPQEITRPMRTHAFPDDPGRTRRTVLELVDAGVTHVVLNASGRSRGIRPLASRGYPA